MILCQHIAVGGNQFQQEILWVEIVVQLYPPTGWISDKLQDRSCSSL
jgi:hypothetical protein